MLSYDLDPQRERFHNVQSKPQVLILMPNQKYHPSIFWDYFYDIRH